MEKQNWKKQNRYANPDPKDDFLVENCFKLDFDVISRSGYDDGQFYEGMPRQMDEWERHHVELLSYGDGQSRKVWLHPLLHPRPLALLHL